MPLNFKDAGTVLAAGLPGVAGANQTTTTNGTTEQNQTEEGNTNTFSNQNLTTWLSNLINSLQEYSNNTSSSTKFDLDPSTKALIDKLTAQYSSLATPFDSQRYQAGQIQGINANSDLQQQAVQQIMASRGVSGPAAATAENNVNNARFAQINQMQQQVPFLANQYNMQNLGAAANFMSMIPKGTTTTGTGSGSQTLNQSSNQSGNTVSNSSGGSTNFNQGWSKGTTNQTQTTKDNTPGWLRVAGLGAGVAASLFSDETLKTNIKETDPDKSLKAVLALKPSTWNWTKDDSRDMGVIAQELREVLPELVHKDPEGSGKLKVNYAGLISQLVGAVQSLSKRTEVLA